MHTSVFVVVSWVFLGIDCMMGLFAREFLRSMDMYDEAGPPALWPLSAAVRMMCARAAELELVLKRPHTLCVVSDHGYFAPLCQNHTISYHRATQLPVES